MSEMVERVARAICARRAGDHNKYESFSQNDLELAYAAIAAMREPTHEMQEAGYCRPHDWKFVFPLGVWMHMIDEALK